MKQMIRNLAFALATSLLAAAPTVTMAAPSHTGILGQTFLYVSYGPGVEVAPGFWVAPPSVQMPMPAAFTVLSARNGRQVARVTTDSAGAYAVSLPPGSYVLVPDPLSLGLGCSVSRGPIEVTVHPKQYTLLNIFYFSAGPPCVLQAVR